MLHRTLILIAAASLTPGCSSKLTLQIPDEGGAVLAERQSADGDIVYKLHPGAEGGPTINRYISRTIRRATLGVRVTNIDGDLSKRIGVTPGRGLYVDEVIDGGPAARGGLLDGDILLSMNGTEIVSVEQLGDRLQQHATPGVAIPFQVKRPRDGAVPMVMNLTVVPDSIDEPDTESVAFALKAVPEVQQFTGLQLTEIPADLAQEIYSTSGPLTLVSGVVVGSPAYLAGVRRGDVIRSCDGVAITSPAPISRALDRRLGRTEEAIAISSGTPLSLDVSGQLGEHHADVWLTDNLDDSTRFKIPILFGYQSDLSSTRWSFLDFIFQFGGNYRTQYVSATSREPAAETYLSLFPLGMFEFDLTPVQNQYTILWLISWTTSR